MHIHHQEDEEGRVKAGTLSAVIDGRAITVPAGESAVLPRGLAHRWWNAGDDELIFEGVVRPLVDIDQYLQAIFEIVNAGPPGRPSLFYLAHLSLRHRQTQEILVMPRPVQAVLFRAVVLVGTLLGRYRGTDWPGCPTRCAGAPATRG